MLAHGKCELRRSAHLRDCHAETGFDKSGLAIWETDNGQLRDYEVYWANRRERQIVSPNPLRSTFISTSVWSTVGGMRRHPIMVHALRRVLFADFWSAAFLPAKLRSNFQLSIAPSRSRTCLAPA
jgi:hypothetical protein